MTKAILLKEWVKLGKPWLGLLAATLLAAAYLCLRVRHVGEMRSMQVVWDAWIQKGWMFCEAFRWAPVLSGAAVAALQFLPEVSGRRMRIALHLPCPELRMLLLHLLVGLALALAAPLAGLALLLGWSALILPAEMTWDLLQHGAYWLLAGHFTYHFAAAALLESRLVNRLAWLAAGAGMVDLCLLPQVHDSGIRLLPLLALAAVPALFVPLLSGLRLRKGLCT